MVDPKADPFPWDTREQSPGDFAGEAERRELLRAEESLRQSEEVFHLLVESVTEYAIFMLDPAGYVLTWNLGAQRIKGYRAEEIIGRHFSTFYPPEALARGWPKHELEVALAQGRFEDEGWRVRKDGSHFWANVVFATVYDQQGGLRGFSKVTHDLTERKRRAEDLAAADRRKNEFLATLAHELRNPLAPLRYGLHLLRLAEDDPEIRRQARDMMERQLGQLVRLVDDLLDVSRITNKKLCLRKEPLDVITVIHSAVETARPFIEAAGHQLTVTLPPEPVYLEADLTRLAQVFVNLLHNGAKYTHRGGHVWLAAERRGSEIMVSVRDTGIGIRAEHLPHLFEMFTQVTPALERSDGGLGIGLSLVRGLLDLHGGTVEAHSAGVDSGSEFVVRLPVSETPAQERQHPAGGEQVSGSGPKRRVLVADDNRDSADGLGTLLELKGYEVRTAHDGLQAVEATAAFQPAVALLDIGMPGLNGYEAARRIRQEPWGEKMVLIALTGWGQDEDKQRAKEAGFDHHMTKPIDIAELEELLLSAR